MGGFGGFLDGAVNAVGQTGVMLKSKRDYEQEVGRYDMEQRKGEADLARSGADLTSANQRNAVGADAATERERIRAGEAEDRATVQDYMRGVSPPQGWQPPAAQAAPAVAPQAPSGMPSPPPQPGLQPGGGVLAPAQSSQRDVRLADAEAAAPPPPTAQPMPASALVGTTLSAEQPAAPPAQKAEPGGPPTLAPPPRAPAPEQAAAPPVPYDPGHGRAGLIDALVDKALARGDKSRADQLRAEKQVLVKEGFGQAAHASLLDPKNVRAIEAAFNENGGTRIVPGSLVYKGGGIYSGSFMEKDGQARPFNDFNMLSAAMALGVIAPPKLISKKADETVWMQGPDGKLTQIQEAQKFTTITNRYDGSVVTTNGATGDVTVRNGNGGEGKLPPVQVAGVREIGTLVGRVARERSADQIPGAPGNKPLLDQPAASATAQNIYLNNPDLVKNGLNAARAAEIAVAINDKDPSAVTGTAMRNGELWTVVRYGKGKNVATYGIARANQQAPTTTPVAAPTPAPAPAAPAPVAAPVAAPQAPAAPVTPKPPPAPNTAPAAQTGTSMPKPPAPAARDAALDAKVDELKFELPPQTNGQAFGVAKVGQYQAVLVANGAAKALNGPRNQFGVQPMDMLAKVPRDHLRLALSAPDLSPQAKQMIIGYLMQSGG